MKYSISHMRITNEKPYYEGHLKAFAEHICNDKIIKVNFGKMDIRGGFSITLIDNRHCVPDQKFFSSKDALLEYVVAYNEAKGWHGFDTFQRYINS